MCKYHTYQPQCHPSTQAPLLAQFFWSLQVAYAIMQRLHHSCTACGPVDIYVPPPPLESSFECFIFWGPKQGFESIILFVLEAGHLFLSHAREHVHSISNASHFNLKKNTIKYLTKRQ